MINRGGVEDTTFEAEAVRTQKKPAAKAKDQLFENRLSRGKRQEMVGKFSIIFKRESA